MKLILLCIYIMKSIGNKTYKGKSLGYKIAGGLISIGNKINPSPLGQIAQGIHSIVGQIPNHPLEANDPIGISKKDNKIKKSYLEK